MLEDIFKFMKIMACFVIIIAVVLISFAIVKNLMILLCNLDDMGATVISCFLIGIIVIYCVSRWVEENI